MSNTVQHPPTTVQRRHQETPHEAACRKLRNAVSSLQGGGSERGARFRAQSLVLYNALADVADRRDAVRSRLEAQDAWLTEHPDHPEYEQRTDVWLRTMATYQMLEDALVYGKAALPR